MNAIDKHEKQQKLLDIEEKRLNESINSCGEKAWNDYVNSLD